MYIWKRTCDPFRMGGRANRNIKTEVNGYPVIELGKGFKGIFIEGHGVFELESGGLIGDTIQDVVNDIAACDDISLMNKQVNEACKEMENATVVTNEVFFG